MINLVVDGDQNWFFFNWASLFIFAGNFTTFKWRNTLVRRSAKEWSASTIFTSVWTVKFIVYLTCIIIAIITLRYAAIRWEKLYARNSKKMLLFTKIKVFLFILLTLWFAQNNIFSFSLSNSSFTNRCPFYGFRCHLTFGSLLNKRCVNFSVLSKAERTRNSRGKSQSTKSSRAWTIPCRNISNRQTFWSNWSNLESQRIESILFASMCL